MTKQLWTVKDIKTNDKNKYCDIHHIIYLINNIKNIVIHTIKKIYWTIHLSYSII
jgi:hypothetical protein